MTIPVGSCTLLSIDSLRQLCNIDPRIDRSNRLTSEQTVHLHGQVGVEWRVGARVPLAFALPMHVSSLAKWNGLRLQGRSVWQ